MAPGENDFDTPGLGGPQGKKGLLPEFLWWAPLTIQIDSRQDQTYLVWYEMYQQAQPAPKCLIDWRTWYAPLRLATSVDFQCNFVFITIAFRAEFIYILPSKYYGWYWYRLKNRTALVEGRLGDVVAQPDNSSDKATEAPLWEACVPGTPYEKCFSTPTPFWYTCADWINNLKFTWVANSRTALESNLLVN